jgi:putative transposase
MGLFHLERRKIVQLIEQHASDQTNPRLAIIDEAAFKSKNLFNAALYLVRQTLMFHGRCLNYNEVQNPSVA